MGSSAFGVQERWALIWIVTANLTILLIQHSQSLRKFYAKALLCMYLKQNKAKIIPVKIAVKSHPTLASKTLRFSLLCVFQDSQSLSDVFLKLRIIAVHEVCDIVKRFNSKVCQNVDAEFSSQTLPWASVDKPVEFLSNFFREAPDWRHA